jgi:hypothetical protein
MKKEPLFSVPFPSTGMTEGPVLVEDERGLVLSLTCADEDGRPHASTVLFSSPRAYRKREETYCTAWHVQDSYDTICEVMDSDWVEELRRDAVPEWRNKWVMRHFMVFLDGFGCLEVVAESASLDDGAMSSRKSGGT